MKKLKLKLNQLEYGLIINALNEFRNKLIRENEDTTLIDDLLLKLFKEKGTKI